MKVLVLKTKGNELLLKDVILFGAEAVKNGRTREDKVKVSKVGTELRFTIAINPPKPQVSTPKKKTITKKSVRAQKEQKERVAQQIAEHKKKKAAGEHTSYVPPVAGTVTNRKVKCPVCNWKKPVVTIGGAKMVKPHIRNGEPCNGGGTQV